MRTEEIKRKRRKIEQRLKEHDAARKLIEAEMDALQHVCPHKNSKTGRDYDGGSSWYCSDCGKNN
jgi:transposase-like protein